MKKANQTIVNELTTKVEALTKDFENYNKYVRENWSEVDGEKNVQTLREAEKKFNWRRESNRNLEDLESLLEFEENLEVGKDVTVSYYSDAKAFRIIEVAKSGKSCKIQRLNATLQEGSKPEFIPGGFAAHCTNNRDLNYDYSENPDGEILKVSRRKDSKWRVSGTNNNVFSGAREFYDYNF